MWGRKNIILLASGILIVVCMLITFLSNAGEKKTMLTFRDGSTYTGTTNEGKPVKGTLKFKNGDVYTGGFKDGHFEGRGTFKSHNGWTFTGIFHKGVANGAGKLQDKDHVIQAGNYVKGEYKGK